MQIRKILSELENSMEQRLIDIVRDNFSIQDLEQIIAEKKKQSKPVELTYKEQVEQLVFNELTKGANPKLHPPKYIRE